MRLKRSTRIKPGREPVLKYLVVLEQIAKIHRTRNRGRRQGAHGRKIWILRSLCVRICGRLIKMRIGCRGSWCHCIRKIWVSMLKYSINTKLIIVISVRKIYWGKWWIYLNKTITKRRRKLYINKCQQSIVTILTTIMVGRVGRKLALTSKRTS